MTRIAEKVVLLGAQKSSVAIVAQPADAAEVAGPAIVIINTGIIHRVGHNRMYVTLARELAEAGHVVVRLDLSGIGDSDPRTDIVDPLNATLADIKEAIDWACTSRGAKGVVLMGLCSGADHSIVYAGRDPRVVGAILLDPSIPPTPLYHLNSLAQRLRRRETWTNLLLGRSGVWRWFRTKPAVDAWEPKQLSFKDKRVRNFLEAIYDKSIQRRQQLLAVFTGGPKYQHNYKRQLLDAMPNVHFGDQLRLEYLARCDHTFTFADDRRRLFDMVKGWLQTTKFVEPGVETLTARSTMETLDVRFLFGPTANQTPGLG